MKKIIAILISITILMCTYVPVLATNNPDANLYDFYSNNMLFMQNEEAFVSGTGSAGSKITVSLLTKTNELVSQGETEVLDNGTFSISFMAPNGGFDEYTIVLKQNDVTFRTLTGIVFGEMWLASGQSNMELTMELASTWNEFVKGGYGNKWVRILSLPHFPDFKDSDTVVPYYPQENIPGAKWARGCDEDISAASAVAYYFACQLMEKLDMPVGILNCSLGGSKIDTWLSRDVIENDRTALAITQRNGSYKTLDNWPSHETETYESFLDYTSIVCGNYNGRLYPLRNFKIKGMIWYQGEANIYYSYGEYSHLLSLMIKQNAKNFGYASENLPIIYSQLASYDYNMEKSIQSFNFELANFQSGNPEHRACMTIYDFPLTYKSNYGTIHPLDKEPIGLRMANSALKLVYGNEGVYTCASYDYSRIDNSDVYVTFKNVGDGLKSRESVIKGFALCGEDGVYYRADAEIVSKDTVKLSSKNVPSPVSATYAYSNYNNRSNIYSSDGEKLLMPAAPFITDMNYQKNIYCDYSWADCEKAKIWHMAYNSQFSSDVESGYYHTWTSSSCTPSYNTSASYKGENGLNLVSFKKNFSIKQYFVKDVFRGDKYYFTDQDRNFSKYGVMSFYVRNNSDKDVTMSNKLYTADCIYKAAINGNVNSNIVIPADGQWHRIELNLNVLFKGDNSKEFFDSSVLTNVEGFEIFFSSDNSKSDIDIDEFNFDKDMTESNNEHQPSIFEIIFNMIKKIISIFMK